MNITIWNEQTSEWYTVRGTCLFEMHGEKFAAHKYLVSPDDKPRWTVAHVGTGFSVLGAGYKGRSLPTTRAAALALAKANLMHRTRDAVQEAVGRAMEKLEDLSRKVGG